MIINVSTDGSVALQNSNDLRSLSLRGARPNTDTARTALAENGLELTPESDHGFVSAEVLRALAVDDHVDPSWSSEFDAMVAYAVSKGWTHDDGRLRVHSEWDDG